MLTSKRLRELLHYDRRTGVFTWIKISGNAGNGRKAIVGTLRKNGYREITVDGLKYQASRLAWLYIKGRWPLRDLDHRNTKPDDNRFTNLRLATKSQNAQNKKMRSDNSAGFKGVSPHHNKWRSVITKNGVRYRLGTFTTAEEAHAAYRSAARKLFGKYAYKEQHNG